MTDKKKHILQKKKKRDIQRMKKRALNKANRKRIKHNRKLGGPRDLPEALGQFEDRRGAIQGGWDHL